jgi:ABC-type transport system involved in multi-copper enzyme maturation permease subunit
MLWHKAWLDTRWRFFAGLFVVSIAACGVVLSYPRALEVLAAIERTPSAVLGSGPLASRLAEALAHGRVYRGFVFTQLFEQELPQIWCLFAMLLGAGGIVSQSARGGGLFTLSLPVSRHEIVTARAAVALLELLALSVIPALLITVLSPVVGQSYSLSEGVVHAALLFGGGAVFFSFTFLMSSIFADPWRPPALMAAVFFVIAMVRMIVPGFTRFTLAPVITGASYYFTYEIPWTPLLLSMLTSAVLLFLAARNIRRRDF